MKNGKSRQIRLQPEHIAGSQRIPERPDRGKEELTKTTAKMAIITSDNSQSGTVSENLYLVSVFSSCTFPNRIP